MRILRFFCGFICLAFLVCFCVVFALGLDSRVAFSVVFGVLFGLVGSLCSFYGGSGTLLHPLAAPGPGGIVFLKCVCRIIYLSCLYIPFNPKSLILC